MRIDTFPTYRFLGIEVHALIKADLLRIIESIVSAEAENCILGNHNLHSLYLTAREPVMNNFYAVNTYTYVDGISLILLAKLLGISLRRKHRNGMLDWRDNFLSIAEVQSWRLYFLGGLPEVAANIRARLQVLYPRLQVRCHHGFDAFQTETTVWKEIGEFSPQIIIVGMGMPLQEQWILEARSRVRTKLFIPCGATFEYLVQVQKPAPRWLGPIGLEWFYRLITGPKTLRRRYLIEPFGLLPLILKELTKRRADGNS